MAVRDWPLLPGSTTERYGFAEYSEQPMRARGPHVHRSVYTGAVHVSYGGGRRRRGYVTTPVSNRGDVSPEFVILIAQLSDPADQLRLPRPPGVGETGANIVVQPTRLHPPQRDERGVWRGWRIEFVETGASTTVGPPTRMAVASATLTFVVAPYMGTATVTAYDDGTIGWSYTPEPMTTGDPAVEGQTFLLNGAVLLTGTTAVATRQVTATAMAGDTVSIVLTGTAGGAIETETASGTLA